MTLGLRKNRASDPAQNIAGKDCARRQCSNKGANCWNLDMRNGGKRQNELRQPGESRRHRMIAGVVGFRSTATAVEGFARSKRYQSAINECASTTTKFSWEVGRLVAFQPCFVFVRFMISANHACSVDFEQITPAQMPPTISLSSNHIGCKTTKESDCPIACDREVSSKQKRQFDKTSTLRGSSFSSLACHSSSTRTRIAFASSPTSDRPRTSAADAQDEPEGEQPAAADLGAALVARRVVL